MPWKFRQGGDLADLLILASFALSSLPVLVACLCGRRTRSWLHIQDCEPDAALELGLLKGQLVRSLAELWERGDAAAGGADGGGPEADRAAGELGGSAGHPAPGCAGARQQRLPGGAGDRR